MEKNIDNPSVKIQVNKIENRITSKIKTLYHIELLAPVTMKLLGITENKKTKNKNGENVPLLQVTEVVLPTMIISKSLEFYIHLFQ